VLIEQGMVFVNGSRLDEPYVHTPATDTYPGDDRPMRVPEDSYFVLGDNRPSSADSRLGWFVPADSLVGRAWLSYWPPTRWTLVSQDGKLGQAASPQANLPSVGS
jgi:signal peptidase I